MSRPRFPLEEKTWDTRDSVPEKPTPPGFSHESNVFEMRVLPAVLERPGEFSAEGPEETLLLL